MKKGKRILALLGVVLLLGLYGSTLVFAIIDNSDTMMMFKASVVATIMIPILIWTYTFIFKLIHKKDEENGQEEK